MALQRCPDCRHKISQHAHSCPNCGFSFAEVDLENFRQLQEQRRLHNQEINKKSAKLQLVWLIVFALIIGIASWWQQ